MYCRQIGSFWRGLIWASLVFIALGGLWAAPKPVIGPVFTDQYPRVEAVVDQAPAGMTEPGFDRTTLSVTVAPASAAASAAWSPAHPPPTTATSVNRFSLS